MAEPIQSFSELPHVLIVDDDARIRQLVRRYLTDHGFLVMEAGSADDAEGVLRSFIFDVMVVDVMMPGISGLEFTQEQVRKGSHAPILLLTALGSSEDRISGLEAGADDYLPKPFEPKELLLRLQALLRRNPSFTSRGKQMRLGRWTYDPEKARLSSVDGQTISLTDVENNLLRTLANSAGEPQTRQSLAEQCGVEGNERTIDVQVTRLRRKIEDNTRMPKVLQTVRGKGYVLYVDEYI